MSEIFETLISNFVPLYEILLNKQEVGYTPSGQDYLIRCLNPEHDDNNPSLRVDRVTGIMHCFSCGFSGNLFTHFGAPESPLEVRIHLSLIHI